MPCSSNGPLKTSSVIDEGVFVYFFLIHRLNMLEHAWQKPHLLPSTKKLIIIILIMPRTFKERNIPCTICGREFTNRAGLTNHQRIHRKPSLKKTNPSQPASDIGAPSPSPSVHSFGQPDDTGVHALPEDGPLPLPQPRIGETVTYHPFINGKLGLY